MCPWMAPDDLVLMKLKAGRPHDFEDALSVVMAQRQAINEPYMVECTRRLGIADELDSFSGGRVGVGSGRPKWPP